MSNRFKEDNHFTVSLHPDLVDTTKFDFGRQTGKIGPANPKTIQPGQYAVRRTEKTASAAAAHDAPKSGRPDFPLLSFFLCLLCCYLLYAVSSNSWDFLFPRNPLLGEIYMFLGRQAYTAAFWVVLGIFFLSAASLAVRFRLRLTARSPSLTKKLDIFTIILIAAIIYASIPAAELLFNYQYASIIKR